MKTSNNNIKKMTTSQLKAMFAAFTRDDLREFAKSLEISCGRDKKDTISNICTAMRNGNIEIDLNMCAQSV